MNGKKRKGSPSDRNYITIKRKTLYRLFTDFVLCGIQVGKGSTDKIDIDTVLLEAIKAGNTMAVKILSRNPDTDVNKTSLSDEGSIEGHLPIVDACTYGNIEIVKLLLSHPDIDVNKRYGDSPYDFDTRGNTALITACENGYTDIVKLLLHHPKIDVNKHSYDGGNFPLLSACKNLDIFKLLLNHPNIDVNNEILWEMEIIIIPLTEAIRMRYNKAVKMLLNHPKIDVNKEIYTEDVRMWPTNALYEAIFDNQTEIVKLLIWAGAYHDTENTKWSLEMLSKLRAITIAIQCDHEAIVEFNICCFSARRTPNHALKAFAASGFISIRRQIESYLVPCNPQAKYFSPNRTVRQNINRIWPARS